MLGQMEAAVLPILRNSYLIVHKFRRKTLSDKLKENSRTFFLISHHLIVNKLRVTNTLGKSRILITRKKLEKLG